MRRKKNSREKKRGMSYSLRVETVNRIYDRYRAEGLSNREIWYRHIYPVYGICERTFYNLLKASSCLGEAFEAENTPTLFDDVGYE